jgi:hypothetical protein
LLQQNDEKAYIFSWLRPFTSSRNVMPECVLLRYMRRAIIGLTLKSIGISRKVKAGRRRSLRSKYNKSNWVGRMRMPHEPLYWSASYRILFTEKAVHPTMRH